MKRSILLVSFFFAKIFALLSYFDVGIPYNMLYICIIVAGVLGLLLLIGPYKSKRDTKRIRTSVIFVSLFTLLYYLILPVFEYIFVTENLKNILVINLFLGCFVLIGVLVGISGEYLEFKRPIQSRWICITKFRYSRIIFSTTMIIIAIVSAGYVKAGIPIESIAIASIMIAFP